MKVAVLGAGAWGTALAASIASRNDVVLWARSADHCARMRAERVNRRYLDGVELPSELGLTSDFDGAIAHARGGLAIVATPVAALAETLQRIVQVGGEAPGVLWLCKGLAHAGARLPHEVAAAVAPGLRVGVVSGP
ncbi:MAG: glycerol-3-phosphate dehydrogenase, partial [Burkholderiaceae bacterium]|nr:glycerol-3-phosphate dehydrogenase [Burkholderiaceae bacterium]